MTADGEGRDIGRQTEAACTMHVCRPIVGCRQPAPPRSASRAATELAGPSEKFVLDGNSEAIPKGKLGSA